MAKTLVSPNITLQGRLREIIFDYSERLKNYRNIVLSYDQQRGIQINKLYVLISTINGIVAGTNAPPLPFSLFYKKMLI